MIAATFLVQHEAIDENADACAGSNYHETMLAQYVHTHPVHVLSEHTLIESSENVADCV